MYNLRFLSCLGVLFRAKCLAGHPCFLNTFISSRMAGRTPGLRLGSVLFGRAGAIWGGGGAVGRDTMMEVGRVLVAPLCPSATGLRREEETKG